MTPAGVTFELPLSEDDWAGQVYDYAKLCGWLAFHQRPAQNQRSQWSTAMQGDPGFPDWVFCRGDRLVFAELKVGHKRPRVDQRRWLDQLRRAGQEAYCWTGPQDWPLVQAALRRPPPRVRHVGDIQAGERL
jgi:hypothetical protein